MKQQQFIKVARGLEPADLVLRNARVIDVFSGGIRDTGVAIFGGMVAGLGEYRGRDELDLEGRFLCPGFIDGHIHVESTMLTPPEFARAVIPLGTTSVIIDPHEIANVLGEAGIDYMIESSRGLPVTFYIMLPSCVPTTGMETSGAELDSNALDAMIDRERVLGIAEMMNYPGVLAGDPEVLAKIAVAAGRRIDGHAPGLTGRDLAAYIGAGISSDHECVTAAEAREKLQLGMHIFIREGSTAKNLKELIGAVTPENSHRFSLVTDDRHPEDLLTEGHVDHLVRMAIRHGLPPVTAIRMAGINTAVHFGLKNLGAVAPGYVADLIVLEDLEDVQVSTVFKRGSLVARNGCVVDFEVAPRIGDMPNTVNIKIDSLEKFAIPAVSEHMKVIDIIPDQIITKKVIIKPSIAAGMAVSDPGRDILKAAVVERHHASGKIGLGFVRGLGLKRGALASSVAHDSHNIIVIGADDGDMRLAVLELCRIGGGVAVAAGAKILATVPLPVAGLMSDCPAGEVAAAANQAIAAAAALGCRIRDPFITMSFLALPVVPELKLTDMGLVDVDAFGLVDLFE